MGECDLHLLHAPYFDGPDRDLTIDIRTKIRYSYSYIESAVVKIGEDTLQVSSYGDYMLNGVSRADLANATISDFPIVHSHPMERVHQFEIQVSGEEKIVLKTFKDMVSVNVQKAEAQRFHGSLGMMGQFETGKLMAPDGKTIISDPNALAAQWQVRQDEPSYFQVKRAPQHPQPCKLPLDGADGGLEGVKARRRRLGASVIERDAAEVACAGWPKEMKEMCVHDTMAAGDLGLAKAGFF